MASLRLCNRCKRELPISEFYTQPSGIRRICKKCDNEYSRNYHKTHPEYDKRYEKEYARRNPKRRWATACLSGHRRNGYITEITSKELYQIACKTELCFICGCQIDWQLGNKGHMHNKSPTLDRLDNGDTIRSGNVLIMCYQCNATKRDRTLKEFLDYCRVVTAKFATHT